MADYLIDVLIQLPSMPVPKRVRVTPRLAVLLDRRMEHRVMPDGQVVYFQLPETPAPRELAHLADEDALCGVS